ncbi:RND family transporter [Thermodesulfobacteriota bacterium]
MLRKLTNLSINNPKSVVIFSIIITILFGYFATGIKIDTDPENMLSADSYVRVFHHEVKERFNLSDFIVLGISHEESVFNKDTLKRVSAVTEEILEISGVVADDVISPTTTNNVILEDGTLVVRKIMSEPPEDAAGIEKLKHELLNNPMFENLMISSDEKAFAIFIPIESKDMSYRIATTIEEIADTHLKGEKHYVTGLPVAEDTFGYSMFMQMGISAPLAALVIFIIMLFFFRRVSLVSAPMIIAVMSIVWTMGLLIGAGYTVHIMSSMIPIFLMPISVVDSVHVLSEFHDNFSKYNDKKETLRHVMSELSMPMLYTSLTSSAGFASLAFTPIPPVRVFGLFVAFGIFCAWLLTIMFVPAYIVLTTNEESLKKSYSTKKETGPSILMGFLKKLEHFVYNNTVAILVGMVIIAIVSIYGITKINVNDNPVNWFEKSHKIRVADKMLNEHMGGTYMPFLILTGDEEETIKSPEVMKYIDTLQAEIVKLETVGKTTSIADIVKRINFILHEEDEAYNVVPDTREEIAQYLFLYLMSGEPDDLDHFVDYDYLSANVWIQSKRGDNQEIEKIVNFVNGYIEDNPLPGGLKADWAGLSYINIVWQRMMTGGMIRSLLGSFVIVLVLMTILFRSPLWGLISMIPLTVTITFTYGFIGLIGKDYDMPTAVLSSLTLGLSVDFAIHFIERFRQKYKETNNFDDAVKEIYAEPARAIFRNAIIIAIGFTPLLFASLVPYKTVGMFLASIMILSCMSTLMFLLPFIKILRKPLGLK